MTSPNQQQQQPFAGGIQSTPNNVGVGGILGHLQVESSKPRSPRPTRQRSTSIGGELDPNSHNNSSNSNGSSPRDRTSSKEKLRTRDKVNILVLEVQNLRRELEEERKARQILSETLNAQLDLLREQLRSLTSSPKFEDSSDSEAPSSSSLMSTSLTSSSTTIATTSTSSTSTLSLQAKKDIENKLVKRRSFLLTGSSSKEDMLAASTISPRKGGGGGLFSGFRKGNKIKSQRGNKEVDGESNETEEGDELIASDTGDSAKDNGIPFDSEESEAIEQVLASPPVTARDKDANTPTTFRRWKSNIWRKKEDGSVIIGGETVPLPNSSAAIAEEISNIAKERNRRRKKEAGEDEKKRSKEKDKEKDKKELKEAKELKEESPKDANVWEDEGGGAGFEVTRTNSHGRDSIGKKSGSRLPFRKKDKEDLLLPSPTVEERKRGHRRSRSLGAGITDLLASIPIVSHSDSPAANASLRSSNVSNAARLKSELKKSLVQEDNSQLVTTPCKNHHVETGCDPELFSFLKVKNALNIEDSEGDEPQFKHYFADSAHTNYIGQDDVLGWVIVSVEGNESKAQPFVSPRGGASTGGDENKPLRVLVRSKTGTKRLTIYGNKRRKKKLQEVMPNLPAKLVKVKDPKLVKELVQYEQQHCEERRNYKFGVLFALEGQTEDEMYGNEHGSPEFNEFLECIGERVALESWNNFAGGLDVKRNSTGVQSVFTRYNNFQIMTHVSTLLPYSTTDKQQLERKRHIGNDVAVIIFKEGSKPWSPQIMRSHFNYVFCVVSKVPSTATVTKYCTVDPETREVQVRPVPEGKTPANTTFYRVAFASKKEVAAFSPHLPEPAIFEKSIAFRNFLLVKLINSERATMTAPEFANMLTRTRFELLKDISQRYLNL